MQPGSFVVSLVAGLGMIAVGALPLLSWTRRRRTGVAIAALGALAWVVTVAVKAAIAIPTNAAVKAAIGLPAFELYVGLLTGVTEVGLVVLAARLVPRLRRATEDEAIAFGLAFGGIEAVLLGAVAIAVHQASGPLPIFVGVLERASAMVFHLVASVLVLRGGARAKVAAFVYKSAVDAFAAWGILSFGVKTDPSRLVVFEIVLAAFALTSLVLFTARPRRIDAVV